MSLEFDNVYYVKPCEEEVDKRFELTNFVLEMSGKTKLFFDICSLPNFVLSIRTFTALFREQTLYGINNSRFDTLKAYSQDSYA
jgi:hypothetical protein